MHFGLKLVPKEIQEAFTRQTATAQEQLSPVRTQLEASRSPSKQINLMNNHKSSSLLQTC